MTRGAHHSLSSQASDRTLELTSIVDKTCVEMMRMPEEAAHRERRERSAPRRAREELAHQRIAEALAIVRAGHLAHRELTTDGRGLGGVAQELLARRLDPPVGIGRQQRKLLGMLKQGVHARRDQVAGGVAAGIDQQHEEKQEPSNKAEEANFNMLDVKELEKEGENRQSGSISLANIYLHKGGKQSGPYTLNQIEEFLKNKDFSMEDLACWDGENWQKVSGIPGLNHL